MFMHMCMHVCRRICMHMRVSVHECNVCMHVCVCVRACVRVHERASRYCASHRYKKSAGIRLNYILLNLLCILLVSVKLKTCR